MFDSIELDYDAMEHGRWFQSGGSSLKIAYIKKDKLVTALDLSNRSVSLQEYVELLAEYVLLDWKKIFDPKGNELPYSKRLAIIAMADEFVCNFVISKASDIQNFKIET